MQASPGTPSPGSRKFAMGGFSPVGLHVLVVDDDPLCLMVLERMLRQCSYNVTTCNRVNRALQLLRENKDEFDLVISDVYMPDEDGFKLLEVIGLELDLPVIMMSANGETSVVMQGITHGACDYLIKPIRIEELRNIWQHVIRHKGKELQRTSTHGELDEILRGAEPQDQGSKKRKEFLEMEESNMDGVNSLKKARVNWSIELHRQFVDAVNQLGIDKAVPKRILDIMNVQGLTRENVASHLQKYRLYLKRLSGVVPEPCPIASFQASGDGLTGGTMLVQVAAGKAPLPNTGVKGRNLGAGIGTGVGKDKKIDVGTMESLALYKLHQQKHAANRAQVLGGLGLSDTRSSSEFPAVGLHRMGSLDLKFFLQDSSTAQSADALDDLAACSFRNVKLEDDAAMTSGISVSGVNNKRTYASRQSAANSGHVSGQCSKRAVDAAEVEEHKRMGATSEANELDTPAAVFCESGSYDKVMDNMIVNKVGGSSSMGLNQETNFRGAARGATLRDNKEIPWGPGYNAGMVNTTMGLSEAQGYLQSMGMNGPTSAVTHASSLVDLADDAVSSTNVEVSTSSFTDNSMDAFSESSFSALAQVGGIRSPVLPLSSLHLIHNNELDISDYLQLDDGFGF